MVANDANDAVRAVNNGWLIDKSALVRLGASPAAAQWITQIERGLVRIANITRLEIGFSARNKETHYAGLFLPPVSLMPVEYLTPRIEERAIEVQSELANRGHHRAPSIPDLLIAATAEINKLTVLHLDKDFELIATITGQTTEKLAGNWN